MQQYLVFDWGGTFMKYALIDESGNIIEKYKIPSVSKDKTKEDLYHVLDEIVEKYSTLDGIAISSAGVIDSSIGLIHTTSIFPFLNETFITKELSDRYNIKVTIENDGKCATLAEIWQGNLQDINDGAVIIIGTSVGGALILDHKLRRGNRFLTGEFCSMCINVDHPEVVYSYVGQKCSTPYLCKLVQEEVGLENEISGEQAFALINEGNEKALHALKRYTDILALFLFNIYVSLDLEKILIGGGISEQPILLGYLNESILELKNKHHDLVKGIEYPLPVIDVCKFHNDANLLGALYYFLSNDEVN